MIDTCQNIALYPLNYWLIFLVVKEYLQRAKTFGQNFTRIEKNKKLKQKNNKEKQNFFFAKKRVLFEQKN
jgi:hypothetical protein